MNNENLSDFDIKQLLEKRVNEISAKIESLQIQLRKAQLALGAFIEAEPESAAPMVRAMVRTKLPKNKLTAAGRMEYVLSKFRVPMTSLEILKAMNEQFPNKKLEQESWSPQLSNIYRDERYQFKRIEFLENPQETRFFYGLKQWFEGDALKQEFMEKLMSRHRINFNNVLFK